MSRFYLNETYVPQIKRLLTANLTAREIGEVVGFGKETVKKFIKKHQLIDNKNVKA